MGKGNKRESLQAEQQTAEINRMLNGLIRSLESSGRR
jgi:hypothetical protein